MNGKITLCAARGTIFIVVVHWIKPVLIHNEHKEGMIVGLLNLLWISIDAFDSWFVEEIKNMGLSELDGVWWDDNLLIFFCLIMSVFKARIQEVLKGELFSR